MELERRRIALIRSTLRMFHLSPITPSFLLLFPFLAIYGIEKWRIPTNKLQEKDLTREVLADRNFRWS